MTTNIPTFAVVGHPNKGKSSIVATLVHNDRIEISELSGTTDSSSAYLFDVGGQATYKIFDTPGFQRPRQTFEAIESLAKNASERLGAVKSFIEQHKHSPTRFKDEVELLQPIVDGAGIIYVVDGSVPYSPEYEAEMAILQWTGQARMALINPIGGEQFVEQWQQALGQYFSLVQVFNPMTADLEKQLSVLSTFVQLKPEWAEPLRQAIELIRGKQEKFRETLAYALAEYLSDAISFSAELPLASDALKEQTQATLKKQYEFKLVALEKQFQQRVIQLYEHHQLKLAIETLEFDVPDLLNQDYWYLFGLSKTKLISLATMAGAAAGAVLDVGVGGASFMTGSILGGLTAGAASFLVSSDPTAIKLKGFSLGGKKLVVGPINNTQFRFVLLGRAVYFQKLVENHTHANREILTLDNNQVSQWIEGLDKTDQVKLAKLLSDAQKGLSGDSLNQLKVLLARSLTIHA